MALSAIMAIPAIHCLSSSARRVFGSPKDAPSARRRYTRRDINFLAAWIVPLNVWYILPARALRARARVYFYPSRRSGWSERYREAWRLLGLSFTQLPDCTITQS